MKTPFPYKNSPDGYRVFLARPARATLTEIESGHLNDVIYEQSNESTMSMTLFLSSLSLSSLLAATLTTNSHKVKKAK